MTRFPLGSVCPGRALTAQTTGSRRAPHFPAHRPPVFPRFARPSGIRLPLGPPQHHLDPGPSLHAASQAAWHRPPLPPTAHLPDTCIARSFVSLSSWLKCHLLRGGIWKPCCLKGIGLTQVTVCCSLALDSLIGFVLSGITFHSSIFCLFCIFLGKGDNYEGKSLFYY